MRILSRAVFREIISGALLGTLLFTFALFLQRLGALFEVLVRTTAPAATVGYLFLLVLPPVLPFAIPIGVLVGVLIGLGRMSSDGEITAMRAAGVPSRRVLPPVLTFAVLAMIAAGSASLWLTPLAIRERYRVQNKLIAEQLTAEVQPRVFEEQFPKKILFVGDVIPGPVAQWRNIFMADLTPPEERPGRGREYGDSPVVTVASQAIATPDVENNRIQLSMVDGSTHEVGKDPSEYYSSSFPQGRQVLEAKERGEVTAKAFTELDTRPLILEARKSVEARIELHRRFALPLACVLLAVLGIPLAVSSKKSGKSGAFVVTVFLAFLYYMALISLIGLAEQGKLPVEIAVWTPNFVFAVAGLVLMARLERPGDRDLMTYIRDWIARAFELVRGKFAASRPQTSVRGRVRSPVLGQVIDTFILSSFLFYFGLLLFSFVLMTHVFIFFDLLSDILKNNIPMAKVFTYHFFLTPKLIYDAAPLSVLVAVLVTFGIMTKNNEVTAMKACGVSLYRLAVPVLVASFLMSGALFAFDHRYVPEANRIQDALLNEIKGRPVQTYLRPDRKWILASSSKIYYYKYLDATENVVAGINVYLLDPKTFRLRSQISAERARWEPRLKTWILQNGWRRDLDGVYSLKFQNFQAATFPEVEEPPSYFVKEAKQDKQMNFRELESYIGDLQRSGFDTVRLRVQLHRKFSVPLFALIMALLSIPFAFLAGSRGAMAGVGVSFGVAIAYWSVSHLFEQIGNLNQLPAIVAAWSPDAVFCLAGIYLFTRMET